jgi:hypothetical protein
VRVAKNHNPTMRMMTPNTTEAPRPRSGGGRHAGAGDGGGAAAAGGAAGGGGGAEGCAGGGGGCVAPGGGAGGGSGAKADDGEDGVAADGGGVDGGGGGDSEAVVGESGDPGGSPFGLVIGPSISRHHPGWPGLDHASRVCRGRTVVARPRTAPDYA